MRRLGAVERVAPGALSRLIEALNLPERPAERLRGDPRFAVFETGGLAPRSAISALRKRLISAQLRERVDHRSGAYRSAAATALRALAEELRKPNAIMGSGNS